MSWDYKEYKRKQALLKKEDPIGWKFNHINHILGKIKSSICSRMNWCGWNYKKGSIYEKMDYFYHWQIENFDHRKSYDFKDISKFQRKIIDIKTQKLALEYIKEAYELFLEGQKLVYTFSTGEFNLYDSWFKKNIKKLQTIK